MPIPVTVVSLSGGASTLRVPSAATRNVVSSASTPTTWPWPLTPTHRPLPRSSADKLDGVIPGVLVSGELASGELPLDGADERVAHPRAHAAATHPDVQTNHGDERRVKASPPSSIGCVTT